MIKAIIFDCFGVLTTDKWRAFLDELPNEADIEQARSLNKALDAGIIGKQEFLDSVEQATGSMPPDIESMGVNEISKNTPLLTYIRELKPKYKLGILSNISSDWIRESFLTSEEQSLFDDMVFSHDIGTTKPDPRAFLVTCQRLGVQPEEAVMIDDIDTYCAAARELGMQAIVYDNLVQLQKDLHTVLSHG